MLKLLTAKLIAFLIMLSLSVWSVARAEPKDYSTLYNEAVESIVFIKSVFPDNNGGVGTGFFFAENLILTANHVLGPMDGVIKRYFVTSNDFTDRAWRAE